MTKTNVACALLDCLEKLWMDEKHCDIIIKVGDRTFPCHRTLLAASSPEWDVLLQNHSAQNGREPLDIADVGPELFELLLRSLYTGDFCLTNENVIEVWEATITFRIDCLVRECEEFVKEELSLDNYLHFFGHVKRLGSPMLNGHLRMYIMVNFEHFRLTEDFLQLSPEELFKMVEGHDLVVVSEDHVIESVLKWVGHKPKMQDSFPEVGANHVSGDKNSSASKLLTSQESSDADKNVGCSQFKEMGYMPQTFERIKDFPRILKAAKLICVSIGVLEELLRNPVVASSPEALEAVHEALVYQWKGSCYNNIVIPYRACANRCNVVVYVHDDQIKMYSLADGQRSILYNNKWNTRQFLKPTGIAAVDGYICLTRYTSESNYQNDGKRYSTHYEVFSKERSSWVCLATRQGIHHHILLALNGSIVVLRPERVGTGVSLHTVESGVWGMIEVKVHGTFCHAGIFQGGILEFYETGGVTKVVCHDVHTKKAEDVGELDDNAGNIVCFQNLKEVHILQGSGQLWRVVRTRLGCIQLEKLNKLWTTDIDICGAVCYGETLFVFKRESRDICEGTYDFLVDDTRKCPAENSDDGSTDKESCSTSVDCSGDVIEQVTGDVIEHVTGDVTADDEVTPVDACWGEKKIKMISLSCDSQVVLMTVPKAWITG